MMRTPITYPIKAAAGFHYCKLLSPFRAVEWIYIDSLRGKEGKEGRYEYTPEYPENPENTFLQ